MTLSCFRVVCPHTHSKDWDSRWLTRLRAARGYDLRSALVRKQAGRVVRPQDAQGAPRIHGDVLTAISEGMVGLLKEFYGRGPSRAKTYYEDDLVVCLLRGGFTRVEQTLLDGG